MWEWVVTLTVQELSWWMYSWECMLWLSEKGLGLVEDVLKAETTKAGGKMFFLHTSSI